MKGDQILYSFILNNLGSYTYVLKSMKEHVFRKLKEGKYKTMQIRVHVLSFLESRLKTVF
jgi:VCBS repeat-containing protein